MWFVRAVRIDKHADGGNHCVVCPYDIDCFLKAPTTGQDVFKDDKPFIRRNLETAAQDKFALIFFDKNVAFAKRASDFLANNNPAESRGDHRVTIKLA